MVSRLVLGCSTPGNAVLRALGTDDVHVIEEDTSRVETLRNEGIDARTGDPTDPETVRDAGPADVIFVAGDDPAVNERATTTAAETFPDANLVVFFGTDASRDQRRRMRSRADRGIDAGTAVLGELDDVSVDDVNHRRGLRNALEGVVGSLAVVPHSNPDPDAIAAAVALVRIARSLGVPADVWYYGEISHQENRALVNRLDYDLRNLSTDEVPDAEAFALVDHSQPGVNDHLPRDVTPAVVIDHHPSEDEVTGEFVDVRVDVGATSTLLTDYLRGFGLTPEADVATGLLYGIHVDTSDFMRETAVEDFEAAAYLLPHVDREAVEEIESPSMSGDTLDTIARAIRNRRVEGETVVSCVGAISDRDTLAQAADRLLALEGVSTTLVCGFMAGTVYLSARTRGTDVDLGATLRTAFGDLGSAGGHADMAGAQIPLGLFSEVESEAESSLTTILANVVTERFTDAMRARGG
ncbi:MAG: DHH family phosphoesterase [Halobacteriaceae archaeon]